MADVPAAPPAGTSAPTLPSPVPEPPLPAPRPNPLYEGLSQRARVWIISLAAIVAAINLALAWSFAFETQKKLTVSVDEFKPYASWLDNSRTTGMSTEAKYDLAARALHLVALSKMIANKNGIVLSCFGAAFALSALGFALFLLGADGAFKVLAETPGKASVAITGAAPGLLCFVLAAWLVVVGVKRESTLSLPPLLLQYGAAPSAPAEPCQYRNPLTKECIDDKIK